MGAGDMIDGNSGPGTKGWFSRLPLWGKALFVLFYPVAVPYGIWAMWKGSRFTQPIRIALTTAGAILMLWFVFTVSTTDSSKSPEAKERTTPSVASASVKTEAVSEQAPAVIEPAAAPTPKPADPAVPQAPVQPVLPDLAAADIKVNLEKTWGLKFTGPQNGKTMLLDHGEVLDPDTGATLICDIYEDSPSSIFWVEFDVDASGAGSVPASAVNEVAKGYFGFCATIPYGQSQPVEARTWVSNHVPAATKQGKVFTQQFGPANYELYGTQLMRTLEIKPAAK